MEEASGTASGLECPDYDSKEALIAILNQHLEKWEVNYGDEKKPKSGRTFFLPV